MNNFRIGQRIRNIKKPKSGGGNYLEFGEVVDVIDGVVYVEYENGDEGHSSKPSEYYQIINNAQGNSYVVDAPVKTNMNLLRTIKRMTMNAGQKALIDSDLKSECGTYTKDAIDVLLQEYAAENEARLIEIANGILEERKAQKEANK